MQVVALEPDEAVKPSRVPRAPINRDFEGKVEEPGRLPLRLASSLLHRPDRKLRRIRQASQTRCSQVRRREPTLVELEVPIVRFSSAENSNGPPTRYYKR